MESVEEAVRDNVVPERLAWYARRLRAMPPREVVERSGRWVRHRSDAASYARARRIWRARWEPDLASVLRADPLGLPTGFLLRERAVGLRQRFPDEIRALRARAELSIENRIRFFGYPEVVVHDLRTDTDPFTGRRWASRHGKRVGYRHGAPGDPKWIWELNRLQELPLLVAAWLACDDPTYARAASDRMSSWIGSHPVGRGIAWSSGFEAAVRAISLAMTLDALRGTEFLSEERRTSGLRSLWQHARWVEGDPSTGSSANNHRIGELVGLVVLGSLTPELKDAPRWLSDGLDGLSREVDVQICSDGTSAEQAFAYHLFVLDLLLVAIAALDASGHVVPVPIAAAVERSGDALWAQLGREEPVPTYGDTDDARALILDSGGLRDARGVAAGIAASCGGARAAFAARELDPFAWWLFGQAGADRFAGAERAPEPASITLPEGGLTILRDGRVRVLFDHGPHGHLSLAAHAHADALRLDLSVGEENLVVDPGVGSYFARPEIRAAFRGTGFHATVLVDGLDSSLSGGPFLWARHARARLLHADLDDGVVVAEHDGYERLADGVTHRRAVIVLSDESIVVVDRLDARGAHRYSQRWPLHPELELELAPHGFAVARRGDGGLLVSTSASHPIVLDAVRGQEEPPAGWWSERLESVEPSWLLSADVEATGVVEIATLLAPFRGDVPEARVELEAASMVSRATVHRPGRTEVVDVALGGSDVHVRRASPAGVVS